MSSSGMECRRTAANAGAIEVLSSWSRPLERAVERPLVGTFNFSLRKAAESYAVPAAVAVSKKIATVKFYF